MARQKLLVPFGGGLDRASGSAVVEPDSFANLQNVHVLRGRMLMRAGSERVLNIGWGTDIIGIFPIRAQGVSAILVFDAVTRDVRMYIVDGELATVTLVGTVWTLPVAAVAGGVLPRAMGVDMYGHLILAHDEPVYSLRQETKVYYVASDFIASLELDLNRDGTLAPVRFRGVTKHLAHLVGWGYGDDTTGDRPEVLRLSVAGQPTVFTPEHYFLVGAPNDPILACGVSGGALEIFKASESHLLSGRDPRTFGIGPADPNHGIVAPHAHVTVGARSYRWGLNGPRASQGGESEDLEFPLDILGPDADPLQSAAESTHAFAYYDPTRGEVVFVFDFWGFVLHLKDKTPRWSYRPFSYEMSAVGLIYQGGVVSLQTGATVPPPTWVARNGLPLGGWQDVVWGQSVNPGPFTPAFARFVAIRNTGAGLGDRAMHSNDGIVWSQADVSINTQDWRALTFAPSGGFGGYDTFVAVSGGGFIANSVDGKFWILAGTVPAEMPPWEDVCFAPSLGRFVAVNSAGAGVDSVATSPDGETWTMQNTPVDAENRSWMSVCWSPELSLFVAVALNGGGTNSVMTSPDGITWTMRSAPNRAWATVTWAAQLGLFIAIASTGSKVGALMTSPDGITWTQRDMPHGETENNIQWQAVLYGHERRNVLAVAHCGLPGGSALGASSIDGTTFLAHASVGLVAWSGLAFSPTLQRFVAVSATNAEPAVMTAG